MIFASCPSVHAWSPKGRSACSRARPNDCEKTLLIAGGIGITPIRALLDELDGDVVVLYRVLKREDAIFGDELEQAPARVEVVAGHHDLEGKSLLSPEHLLEMVPDIAERDVFISGPPGMVNVIEKNVRQRGRAAPARPQRAFCTMRDPGVCS